MLICPILQLILTKTLIQKFRKIKTNLLETKLNQHFCSDVFFFEAFKHFFKILVVESSSIATQVSPSATIVF